MIFDRLALGTANFGQEYNGVKVSEDKQKRILDYCQEVGINMIDTATAYEWDWTNISTYFKVVTKGDGNQAFPRKPYGYLAHKGVIWNPFWCKIKATSDKVGLSIYEPSSIPHFGKFGVHLADIIQVPYSIYDRRFEKSFPELKESGIEIHVRSIFLRGKILEKFKPWECIAFCLMNPLIDRVIIGVDSLEQLQEDLAPFQRMNAAETHDVNVLDPRRWEGDK